MRLRNVKNANEILESSKSFIEKPEEYIGKWHTLFNNDNIINIEIGCGKGTFLVEMAKKYPNINFIGIEKYESVLVRAIEKDITEISNLKFICVDAKNINDYFYKEINTIYLNFSDPWPKTRHQKRRLTSPEFLKNYETIFSHSMHIIQKTDNIKLFAYSLEMYSQNGFILNKVSLDLASEPIDNIKTEYEEKFTKLGYKINYVEASKEL